MSVCNSYTFTFDGIKVVQEQNVKLYTAPLVVRKDGQEVTTIRPARAQYPTKQELLHEVGLDGNFWHDLYGVLSDFDSETHRRATVQLFINPTVRIVWASAFLMVLGGLVCLFDRQRGQKSRDVLGGAWDLKSEGEAVG